MRYLGGKSKTAKAIMAHIIGAVPTPERRTLYEPFIGGGAMTAVLAPHFKRVCASDLHPDLVLMWQALLAGWKPPESITEEEYRIYKNLAPSSMRGFVGFAGSFGAKWFTGIGRGVLPNGTPRNYYAESKRSLLRDVALMQANTKVVLSDYRKLKPRAGNVVYCDPPYAGTTSYAMGFNNEEFWATMDRWHDAGALVFVSEYKAPPGWTKIWSETRMRDLKSKLTNAVQVTECLWSKI